MKYLRARLTRVLTHYFESDNKRIEHALRVLHHADRIMQDHPGCDADIVIASALLHDVGIKVSEEKHGYNDGKTQEKYGPAAAGGLLDCVDFPPDKTQIVSDNGSRSAYLISGKFPGFKTHIAVMIALAPDFSIIGFEVLEHEEDPGLGGEIEQEYFKNQFKLKPFEKIKSIEVVKTPLPSEYFDALEGKVDESAAFDIMKQYSDQDIYALTGATISSAAVSSGVRAMTKKFAYRLDTLDRVLNEQQIAVPF